MDAILCVEEEGAMCMPDVSARCRFHKGQADQDKEAAQRVADAKLAEAQREEVNARRAYVFAMGARAQKKWDELDVDQSDALEGDEVPSMLYLCCVLCWELYAACMLS